jgi:hypothetical protein
MVKKHFDQIDYPPHQSILEVAQLVITPYFRQKIEQPICYKSLNLALWERLPPKRKALLLKRYFGSSESKLNESALQLNNTCYDRLHQTIASQGDKAQQVRVPKILFALASFDNSEGLILKFPGLSFDAYYTAISWRGLRVFTVGTHYYHDKEYYDLYYESEKAGPLLPIVVIDNAISSNFSKANQLPLKEQELLVDSLSIAIAENYNWSKRILISPFEKTQKKPISRSAVSIFNIPLAQLYAHGLWHIDKQGDKSSYIVKSGNLYSITQTLEVLTEKRILNEQAISYGLRILHPYEYSQISMQSRNKYPGNFFHKIGFFIDNPEFYDEVTRLNMRKLLLAMQKDIPLINIELRRHVENHP